MVKCGVFIIGGGLAGLLAAARLTQLGVECVVLDEGLPESGGSVGGFAKFSGAKFSLPPAGMGLLGVVGTEERLWRVVRAVSEFLELDFSDGDYSVDQNEMAKNLRSYKSLVLEPSQIDQVLGRLKAYLDRKHVRILQGRCEKLVPGIEVCKLLVSSPDSKDVVLADSVFYAGGRLGVDIMREAGLRPINMKGLDVGARIEFPSQEGIAPLLAYGPDAKFIQGDCRTFCLNSPGKIFRYPFGSISVPGGVVADKSEIAVNFGVLYRSQKKAELLTRIKRVGQETKASCLEQGFEAQDSIFGRARSILCELYGGEIVGKLEDFGGFLSDRALVDWSVPHLVHLPLIDWHWETYAIANSFRTEASTIYCIGDSSGHARGLLQAAVSGWVAAEEYTGAS